MKIIKLLILTFGIAVIFISCNRDDDYTLIEATDPMEPEILIEGELAGLLLDNDNVPIQDAVIELNETDVITDVNGYFSLGKLFLSKGGSLLKIKKDGYFDGYKFAYVQPGEKTFMKIHMIPSEIIAEFDSAEATQVAVNGNASLSFPADAISLDDGSPYDGIVKVRAHWYDPSDRGIASNMPGDLRGINELKELVQLGTYGMMAVILEGERGEELQLRENQKATLSFPQPSNFNTPESIPLWHLDEETGYWIEEGDALKDGNMLIAEVSHFSFWNCDAPFEVVSLTGKLVTTSGDPIAGQLVTISTADNVLSGTGTTNESGTFEGKVPAGEDLTLTIYECGETITTHEIGEINNPTDVGTIEVDSPMLITVTGTIVGCSSEPISNITYLLLENNDGIDIFVSDTEGNINGSYFSCNGSDISVQAIDIESGLASEDIVVSPYESVIELEEIEVCDYFSGEYIRFDYVNLNEVILFDADVVIIDDKYISIRSSSIGNPSTLGQDGFSLLSQLDNSIETPSGRILNQVIVDESGASNFINISADLGLRVDVIRTASMVGDTFICKVIDDLFNSYSADVKVVVDRKETSSQLKCMVWYDDNENGIREPNELPANDVNISINPSSNAIGPTYYNPLHLNLILSYSSDVNGELIIDFITPDQEFYLEYRGLNVSPFDQGSDDTVDCDFYQENGPIYRTENILLNPGEIITNIGLGVQ